MDKQILDLLETGNARLKINKPMGAYLAKLEIGDTTYRGEGDSVDAALDALAQDIEALNTPKTTTRQERGQILLESGAVTVNGRPGSYYVKSQSDDETTYTVDIKANICDCPDRQNRNECKHLQAARSYDNLSIYERAKLLIENKAQWYAGESVTIWHDGPKTVKIVNRGVDYDYLVISFYNKDIGSGIDVKAGHLSPTTGWTFDLPKSRYNGWQKSAQELANAPKMAGMG